MTRVKWRVGMAFNMVIVLLLTALYPGDSVRVHARGRAARQTEPDYSDRCGDTLQIPYIFKGLSAANTPPLLEANISNRCMGSTTLGDHFMITTTYNYPTEWMQKHIPVPYLVYFAGGSNETHRHENVALEASGYLTFIAEYYDCLPEVTLFAHPHRESDMSVRPLDHTLNAVQWGKVPGFATMHPGGNNWADFDTRDSVVNLGQPLSGAALDREIPCNQIFNNTAYDYWPSWEYRRAEWLQMAWDDFFGRTEMGKMPKRLRTKLVAEFFVRRERIHTRSRKFYLQALQWLSDAHHAKYLSDWQLAVVFEFVWHYIFGEPFYLPDLTVEPCVLYRCRRGRDM